MEQIHLKEHELCYSFPVCVPAITAAVTTRRLDAGFLHQDKGTIKKNRQAVLAALGLSIDGLVCGQQTHADGVRVVGAGDRGKGAFDFNDAFADTDALITREPGIALAVFTADCLPLFLIDERGAGIGVVHAGWRGTQKKIAQRAICAMREHFKVAAENIVAYFGPAIRRCCYEVGREFKSHFNTGLHEESGRFWLDLVGLNYRQLIEAGVRSEKIFDSGMCTSCRNDIFFSYRKEKEAAGRQMSLIVRRKQKSP